MNALTTHILDTSLGRPARGVQIKLYYLEGSQYKLVRETTTNDDGRTDLPLLSEKEMKLGRYQIVFEMANYFLSTNPSLSEPLFISDIPIQFSITDLNSHYHVPLLASPFAYSTYRGS